MNERYFAKVATILDEYTVVINKGSNHDVKIGDKFIIIDWWIYSRSSTKLVTLS